MPKQPLTINTGKQVPSLKSPPLKVGKDDLTAEKDADPGK